MNPRLPGGDPTVSRCRRTAVLPMLPLLLAACAGGGQDASPTSPIATPAASLTTDEPSVAPFPLVRPLRNPDIDPGVPEILEPGTYVLDRFPVDLAFDIPDGEPPGWHAGQATENTAIVLWYTPPDITYLFAFWNVDNVYVDPAMPPPASSSHRLGHRSMTSSQPFRTCRDSRRPRRWTSPSAPSEERRSS